MYSPASPKLNAVTGGRQPGVQALSSRCPPAYRFRRIAPSSLNGISTSPLPSGVTVLRSGYEVEWSAADMLRFETAIRHSLAEAPPRRSTEAKTSSTPFSPAMSMPFHSRPLPVRTALQEAFARLSTNTCSFVPDAPLRTKSSRHNPASPRFGQTKRVPPATRFSMDSTLNPSAAPAKRILSAALSTVSPAMAAQAIDIAAHNISILMAITSSS